MIISIASGKGGTGKTLVATSIAAALDRGLELIDCDVEEPNSYLFFPDMVPGEDEECHLPVPVIDEELCDRCAQCSDFCAYRALVVFPQEVLFFKELCHGCGGCSLVCPKGAISVGHRSIGKIKRARAGRVDLLWGELDVGEPMATPLIRSVKARARGDLLVIDAPPGTACPVIESVMDSDFCILVTEPTPFGLYDLDRAVRLLEEMTIAHGVLLNKAGCGDGGVYRYCERRNIPLLMEIPMSRRIAELYSRGTVFVREMPKWRDPFIELINSIEEMIQ